jgi:uncharacterized protein (DUF1015 family)
MSKPTYPPLLEPFAALRYSDSSRLGQVLAPPYDVIDADHRARLARSNSHNIVHLILPDDPVDPYDRAARLLAQWRWDGTFQRDEEPTVTIMQQQFKTPDGSIRQRSGVFAAVSAESYEPGRVIPHERTHRGPKEDRLRLMRATRTALDSIFMLTRDADRSLAAFMAREQNREPDAIEDFEDMKILLWIVPGVRSAATLEALGQKPLYIADGHHRYETASAFCEERKKQGRLLAYIVPVSDPGLVVLPAHRVVMGESIDREELLRSIAPFTELSTGEEALCSIVWPDGQHTHLACLDQDPTTLAESNGERLAESLTISMVERHLMPALLTAAGPDAGRDYLSDRDDAILRVTSGDAAATVLVQPTDVSEVLAVSDAGGVMPPKSTYFYPKVPSGIVLWPAC